MCNGSALKTWVDRQQRRDVNVAALAFRSDGSSLAVKLRNISYDGCLLAAETMLSVDEKIIVALPGMGEVKAQVRWSSAYGTAGARFLVEEMAAIDPCSRVGL